MVYGNGGGIQRVGGWGVRRGGFFLFFFWIQVLLITTRSHRPTRLRDLPPIAPLVHSTFDPLLSRPPLFDSNPVSYSRVIASLRDLQ